MFTRGEEPMKLACLLLSLLSFNTFALEPLSNHIEASLILDGKDTVIIEYHDMICSVSHSDDPEDDYSDFLASILIPQVKRNNQMEVEPIVMLPTTLYLTMKEDMEKYLCELLEL
jgi:hypothetical protein